MTPPPAGGIPVYACAVIGHPVREGEILVVPHQHGWALPGAWTRPGERVEDALNRGLHDTLAVTATAPNFLTVAEDPDGLVIVFDAEPAHALPDAEPAGQAWRPLDQLDDLWPTNLRGQLHVDPPPWLPRPPSVPGGADGT